MRATITVVCDVPNVQKLTALRQACHDYVNEDDAVSIIASNSGFDHPEWSVFGAHKGKPDETYRKVVRAENANAAEAQVIKDDPTATVVAVFPGNVQAADSAPAL